MAMPRDAEAASTAFDGWLQETLTSVESEERTARLGAWAEAPSTRAVHPRENHLVRVMVAVGAAEGEQGNLIHKELFMNRFVISSYRFG